MKRKSFVSIIVFACFLFISSQAFGVSNVITVAKSGGDFDNPLDAVNSIGDASRKNPYIVSIAPGVYNLGSTPLYMQSHVSLVGSGQKATYIVGAVDSAAILPDQGPGLINGADASEIRQLTVINKYDGTSAAIHNYAASPHIAFVTAIGRGGVDSHGGGFKYGIWDDGGSKSTLVHVTARGIGIEGNACLGLNSRDSITRIHGSRLVANGCGINNGIAASNGRVIVEDTSIIARNSPRGNDNAIALTSEEGEGSSTEIRNSIVRGSILVGDLSEYGARTIVKIASSKIDGSPSVSGLRAEIHCVGAFDPGFNSLGVSCLATP